MPVRAIDLSSVEQLEFGKAKSEVIKNVLGEPKQVVHLKGHLSDKDAWIYTELRGGEENERLALLVDRASGIAESATWSVKEGEPLYQRDAVLSHFKYAKFASRQVGQVSRDYFSNDLIYSDPRLGITFLVDETRHTVSSISFEVPQPGRLASGS